MRKKIVNRETGEMNYKRSGKKMPIEESIKSGLIILAASPHILTDLFACAFSSTSRQQAMSRQVVSDYGFEDEQREVVLPKLVEGEDLSTTRLLRETVQIIKSKEIYVNKASTCNEELK
jgi:hypothetical protein